jgi:hypothetical protein
MKTFLIVMGTLLGLGVLAVVGVVLLVGSAANDALEAEEKNDTPKPVAEGEPFTHDKYDIAGGWKIVTDEFGTMAVAGVKVTNTGDSADFPMFTFDLMSLDGKELLASADCNSNEIGSGVTAKLDNCLSVDKVPAEYQVTVRDMW